MKTPVIISKEDNWYVAKDIISGVASQGKTIEESMDNLKEALELYYDGTDMKTINTGSELLLATMEI